MFLFYCVVTICNVGYVCSFHGDQIFVDFVSFLSMIIFIHFIYDVKGIIFAAPGFYVDIKISSCFVRF